MIAAASARVAPIAIRPPRASLPRVAALVALVAIGVTSAPAVFEGGPKPLARRTENRTSSGGPATLPLAAQGPVSATLGRHDPAYWVRGLHAANPAQHLAATFSANGVLLAAGAGRAELRLTSYGRLGWQHALAPARPRAADNRVVYRRGGVQEWYANGPFGLEQGFDVRKPPTAGSGPLTLSLALRSNLRARLDPTGLALTRQGVRLRYGGLVATDAAGRRVRAWFGLARHTVTITVADRGARYPLHIDPFVQQAELTASDGAMNDVLGATLAINGDTIVAGAPQKTVGANPGQGALYVFVKPATGWADAHQTAELTSSDGTAIAAVAISGDTIVAGAPGKQVGANQFQGAAYVFVKPAGGWTNGTQTAVLTASNGAANDVLGASVAIDGDTILSGAPGRDGGRGAGYVFVEPRSGWKDATQTAELTALGGAPQDSVGLINSIAISGDTIALGGSNHKVGDNDQAGIAYVYVKPDTGWTDATQTATLSATDGGAGDLFGFAVAVSPDTVVVGAPHHAVGRQKPGAVYVFTEPPFGWGQRSSDTETAELTPSDGATDDRFGAQVGISGTTVVAGAFLHQVGPNPAQGALYFFNRPGFVWSDETQNGQLTAADGSAREGFGDTVGISGNLVAAGAPVHPVGQNTGQGAAYLFAVPPTITIATPANGATFTQGQNVLASYVCGAPVGATLTSCSGPVPAAAAIDTSSPGAHSFTVRTVDSDGATTTQTTSYTVTASRVTATPPLITGFRQSAATWRAGGKPSRRRPPIGTTFSFVLDQPATVTLSFTRQAAGRLHGGHCIAPSTRTKHGRRCARALAAGTLTVTARKGVDEIGFRGRVSSGRTLPPGRYAITTTATNSARQRTTSRPLHFTIER